MLRIRHSLAARVVALALTVSIYIGPGAAWAAKRSDAPASSRITIVVFPLDMAAEKAPARVGKDMAEAIKASFGAIDGYMAITFSERHPTIRRSLEEGSLKRPDVNGPFADDKSAAGRIANDLRADLYLVGSVDEYEVDVQSKTAHIAVSAQLIEAVNGDVIKTLAVTGRSPEGTTEGTASDLAALAAGNAIGRVLDELVPGAPTLVDEVTEPTRGRKAAQKIVLPARSRQAAAPPKRTVVVFPLDVNAASAPAELGTRIGEWLKTSLGLANGYLTMEFSERLPSISRMVQEGSLKKADIAGPFSEDSTSAARLASELGADMFIVGSIDECSVDSTARSAQVGITVQVCEASSGRVLKALAVTGRSPAGTEVARDHELLSLAAGNAAANAVLQIAPETPVVAMSENAAPASTLQRVKKSSTWKMILLGLAVAGGVALASRNGNGGSSGDSDMPPPPSWD